MKYLFLVPVCCIIGCNQESQNSATPQATLVSTAKAVTEELPTYILLPGITQSVHLVEIQARVEGWLNSTKRLKSFNEAFFPKCFRIFRYFSFFKFFRKVSPPLQTFLNLF